MKSSKVRKNISRLVKEWGITKKVSTVKINPDSVEEADGTLGHELVGITECKEEYILVHTRKLELDDIVHELLHVVRPDLEEYDIIDLTNIYLYSFSNKKKRKKIFEKMLTSY